MIDKKTNYFIIFFILIFSLSCNQKKSESAANFSDTIVSFINPISFKLDTFDINFSKVIAAQQFNNVPEKKIKLLYLEINDIEETTQQKLKEIENLKEFDKKYPLKQNTIDYYKMVIDLSQNEFKDIADIISKNNYNKKTMIKFDKLVLSYYKKLSNYYKKTSKTEEKFAKKYRLIYENKTPWQKIDKSIDDLEKELKKLK